MMLSGSQVITSRRNPTVIWVMKLGDRKEREKTHSFRFDGVKLFAEALMAGVELTHILLRESSVQIVASKTESIIGKKISDFTVNCGMTVLSDDVFDKISTEKSPEGVICVGKYIDKFHKIATINKVGIETVNDNICADIEKNEKVILAESMQDPTNVGAVIRCAVAMGIDRIILSADCADIYNSKTVRASMGTLFRQKITVVRDLCEAIGELRKSGRCVRAATLVRDADKLGEISLSPSDCIVIGNEGHGLSDAVIGACDKKIFIPIADGAESLNAATAAAVFMWELRKSRN